MDETTTGLTGTDIAIVGLAGRFPGASDPGDLWAMLLDGRTGITEFTDDELRAAGVSDRVLADPAYVKAGSVLDGIDQFDPTFFGLSATEAQLLDPQQRLFLECSWTALEDAGCDPVRFDGRVAVYGGAAWSTYLTNNLLLHDSLIASTGEIAVGLANEKDSLTTRVSHVLGLSGPSMAVQSYCSTSLVAVATAASSLAGGDCDLALAGGVSVQVPHRVGYHYQEGGMTSPDGRCAAFDESALGTPVGSGVAVVALRRLEDAMRDGDRVYAVIRGWAVNNDAGRKAGFTAPGVGGQADVVAEALASAGIEPAALDYLEAHGTGTALGDAAELAALQQVFDGQSCLIGSVKTNVGHLDRAAGATGLIKTALSLHHEQLPATLNFRTPNRQFRLGGAALEVVTERRSWPRGTRPRRAGVSAFGIGGTNAHVVLEEAPQTPRESTDGTGLELLTWSGRTASAADRVADGLARRFAEESGNFLADAAYTMREGRSAFEHRRFIVAADLSEAASVLRTGPAVSGGAPARVDRDVWFVFPSELDDLAWAGELYDTEPIFRTTVEHCLNETAGIIGTRPVNLATSPLPIAAFATALALGQWLRAHGVDAAAALGAGAGAAAAACFAGALSVRDALTVVLSDRSAEQVTIQEPSITIRSARTGEPIDLTRDRFGALARELSAVDLATEALPGDGGAEPLLLRMGIRRRDAVDGPVRGFAPSRMTAQRAAYTQLGELWLAGVPVDWTRLRGERPLRKVGVPGHPLDRARYWIDPPVVAADTPPTAADAVLSVSVWEHAPAPVPTGEADAPHVVLVGPAEPGLIARLTESGTPTTVVHRGTDLLLSAGNCVIDPAREDHCAELLRWIGDRAGDRRVLVMHFWAEETRLGEAATMIRAIGESTVAEPQLLVVTRGAVAAVPGDLCVPEQAAVVALCIVARQEYPGLLSRVVDLGAADSSRSDVLDALLDEARRSASEDAVALRGADRLVSRQTQVPAAPEPRPVIRPGGTYLVTGGLGDVGPLLAAYLAGRGAARVVLTSRTGRDGVWPAAIQELIDRGVEVRVEAADVTRVARMRELIERLTRRHGRLDGVIHAAGETGADSFVPFRDLTPGDLDRHLLPKLTGARVLREVIDALPASQAPDFCLLFSSVAAVLGGIGFAAYAAANAALTAVAFAGGAAPSATRWVAVQWDTWSPTAERLASVPGAAFVAHAMTTGQSDSGLDRALAAGYPAMTATAADPAERFESRWPEARAAASASTPPRFPRPDLAQPFVPPAPGAESRLAVIWAEQLALREVGADDNFFDLGGTSLLGLQLLRNVAQAFGTRLPAVALFEAPTVRLLTSLLQPSTSMSEPVVLPAAADTWPKLPRVAQPPSPSARRAMPGPEIPARDTRIAIVGMSGRFPGASTVAGLWQNLLDGVESIRFFSPEELVAEGVDPELIARPDYVPARPVIDGVADFDAGFFGFSPRAAALTDPQQRVFLEVCWEALEHAGYGASDGRGRVGVFGGTNMSTYFLQAGGQDLISSGEVNDYEVVMGNDKDALTTTVSYKLNLTGPSVAVQTFCSTSLVAVHLACRSLQAGECDMALAGGVSIRVPSMVGHVFQEGGMASPDGHVRTFDAQARGSMFGDGAAIVALKPLADALRDGDTVWAVIRGSAMNNDGAMKVGYTAPSVTGQAAVIRAAFIDADVRPDEIGYVEAHGTGTPLGDPIEVAALTQAFGSEAERASCALGSVKTNVGHLDRAAGVTGLIKAALAVRTGVLPGQLHFTEPNPEIDFGNSPFYVQTGLTPFPGGPSRSRIAGVSSLGMGGTNVHVVVEEPPASAGDQRNRSVRRYQAVVLSARDDEAADEACRRLGADLRDAEHTDLADAAYTLQTGRAVFPHRRVVVSESVAQASAALSGLPNASRPAARNDATRNRRVAFMFGGVGEQYPGMVAELYRREPVFRKVIDECMVIICECAPGLPVADLLTGDRAGTLDLAALLNRSGDDGPADERVAAMRRTDVAQPLVFAVEYALARTLMTWGVQPELLVGYSLGEYVAACLASVLSLPDALRLVTHRSALIAGRPAGAMLAVPLSADQVNDRFGPVEAAEIDVAVINGADSIVLAGTPAAIRELAGRLSAAGVVSRELDTTHAFHSRQLTGLQDELTAWITANVTLSPPLIPYVSNVTGSVADAGLVCDPRYWARHMCETVRFADGIRALSDRPDLAVVEIGAGQSLGAMLRTAQFPRDRWPLIVATLPAQHDPRPDDLTLTDCLARLWLAGVTVDWQSMHATADDAGSRRRIPLPTYPFRRRRYWLDRAPTGPQAVNPARPAQDTGLLAEASRLPRLGEQEWLYAPMWRQVPAGGPARAVTGSWLIFNDEGCEITTTVRDTVTAAGGDVVLVRPGQAYAEEELGFRIKPGSLNDILRLLRTLRARGCWPTRVLHLWTLPGATGDRDQVQLGFGTLTALARAAGEAGWDEWTLDVLTRATQMVLPGDEMDPARATVTGPVRVIPLEYPKVRARLIDVDDASDPTVPRILFTEDGERVVAVRRGLHWVCDFARLHGPTGEDPLRDEAVYLITGGLGGIGLAMAEELARQHRARLVLLSRTGLPPRDSWDEIVAGGGTADEVTRRRVTAVRAMLAAGAEVEIVTGDVSRLADVEAAVGLALERFGALHGVLHAAGVPGMGLMQLRDPAEYHRAMVPKVAGVEAIAAALRTGRSDEIRLDFLLLFSSITSVTGGGPGQVDYCAANAYLDAFALGRSTTGRRTVTIGWGEWRWNAWSAGLDGYDPTLREHFTQHRARFGIGFDEGWRALRATLASGMSHVIVSTQHFPSIVELSTGFNVNTVRRPATGSSGTRYPRPDLTTAYAAPQTVTEQTVAEAWGDVLRLDRVGVDDNFFELGGNSLIGVDVVARLRTALDLAELPPHVLYEAPTVEKLAAFADALNSRAGAERLAGEEDRRQDRADRRRGALQESATPRRRKR